MRRIKILDTTLRDGEQSPGCSMNKSEKLKIARQLMRLNVDVIEAGFAISSPGDFECVEALAQEIRGCTVSSLCRALKGDIDAGYHAVKSAEDPMLHVFIATSDVHMQYKLKMTRDQVLDSIRESVSYAKSLIPKVEFSCEDATRSDRDFLVKCIDTAVKCGATTINIPDTVGYAEPDEMEELVAFVKNTVPGMEKVILSVHCHDDLGMAVANSLAAVKGGADQIECTINGIGERAGNAAMEEVVMALVTRGKHFDAQTRIDTRQIMRTTTRLSRIIGVSIPPNKAIVGKNAFAHESGIHQHGVLANKLTYEIMTPESVGIAENTMVLGKHSGRHAFEEHLRFLGYSLLPESVDTLFERFKVLADKKKTISDFDIEALVDTLSKTVKYYDLERFVINTGNTIHPTAIVSLKTRDGETREDVAVGTGPIYAAFKAIDKITGMDVSLDDFKISSVTEGDDALGQVSVKVGMGGRWVTGRGLSTDVLESSIMAYIHAINKLKSMEGL
ncbi:MAG: 2-isopropylmalate synthase [Clostridiales bacterium]|nr:MAG: 2-isopropylmalate synthase [Clostridiales bacterium]